MAVSENKNLLQKVVREFRDIMGFFIRIGGDQAAKAEVLRTLGLPVTAASTPLNLPTTNIDRFISEEADKADALAFASAIADFTQISLSIRTFAEAIAIGLGGDPDEGEQAVENMIASFSALAMQDYVRLRNPEVQKAFSLVEFVSQESMFSSGFVNFWEKIATFFKKLGELPVKAANGEALTLTDVQGFSDALFLATSVGLLFVDKKLLKGTPLSINAAYGYDGSPASGSPNADAISSRFMTLAFKSDLADNVSSTFWLTMGIVPPQHGGFAWMFDTDGAINLDFDNTGADLTNSNYDNIGWKVKAASGGGGVFRVGEGVSAQAANSSFFELDITKTRHQPLNATWEAFTIGFQKPQIGLIMNAEEMDVKWAFDIIIKIEPKKLEQGFWQKILPEIDEKPRLKIGMSTKRGFHFGGDGGNSGLRLFMYINVYKSLSYDIFKITVDRIILSFGKPERSENFELETSADFSLKLGDYFAISVSRMGLITPLIKDDDFALKYKPDVPRFRPPTGLGIAIKIPGVFKGGGYLFFDTDRGEYGGAIELEFEKIKLGSFKAVGLFSTKFPDGSEGTSFIVIATLELPVAVELSFNFMIKGFGLIVGVNRGLNIQAIADGVRSNSLQSILFPKDVVANIHRIISDLQQFFPIERDNYVFGLMIRMGWGGTAQKSIADLQLGVLFETKEPVIAIVGILTLELPDRELAVAYIQVNFAGILKLDDNGFVFFRADLINSRLTIYTLTGTKAVLFGWGSNANVVYSSGGFHPDFHDIPRIAALPNAFDNMARLSIRLMSGNNPRFGVETYFAITSNSVQFGGKAELYAEACGFNVYGYLGFDVLFIFNPFHFQFDIYAGFALRRGSSVICGISLRGKVEGPNPWHVKGSASITILFFDVTVPFDETWGTRSTPIDSAVEPLLQKITDSLDENKNWVAELPAYHSLNVTLKEIEQAVKQIVIHPAGVLKFSQNLVPLGLDLQKYGNKVPDVRKIEFSNVNSNGQGLTTDFQNVTEMFARNQYFDMDDHAKLTNKSYEPFRSGFQITGSSALRTGRPVSKSVEYELSYLHQKRFEVIWSRIVRLSRSIYDIFIGSSAVRQSEMSLQSTRVSFVASKDAVILPESFAVASTINLAIQQHDEKPLVFNTQAEALQSYQTLLRLNPEMKGQIQVVHASELV
jgi:hypothetical protein